MNYFVFKKNCINKENMITIDIIKKKLESLNDNIIIIEDIATGRKIERNHFNYLINSLSFYFEKNNYREIIIRENNKFELLLVYFASMFANITVIPVDPDKDYSEVAKIKKLHKNSFFIDIGEIDKILKTFVEKNNYDDVHLNWDNVDFTKLYLITYTSGSTGSPKGVMHSLYSLFYSSYEFGNLMNYSKYIIMGHCMPMTYMAGILNTIIMPYLFGGKIIILPRFSIKNAFSFWNNIIEYNINTLWLSPTMLRVLELTDKNRSMKQYFCDNRFMINVGTAPLDDKLRNVFESEYNIRLYQSYGLSETLFISSESLEEVNSSKSVGVLLDSIELKINDDGELCVKTPWMFIGYTNYDYTKCFTDGYYLTGDLGKLSNNILYVVGRKKDIIIKGGFNINPYDIEKCLYELNFVKECAVVPLDINGEELIHLSLVCEEIIDITTINSFLSKQLGNHYLVDYVDIVTSIPKNINGKIDRIRIKKEMDKKYDT